MKKLPAWLIELKGALMQQQAQSIEQLDALDLEAELEAAQSPRKHLDMALYAQGVRVKEDWRRARYR
jgi:hypothetical protein